VIGAFGSGIRNVTNQITNPKIMAPTRGLRLSSKLDEIVVAIVPATSAFQSGLLTGVHVVSYTV
jgi:hypothetical protein